MTGGSSARRGYEAEDFVAELFRRLGYEVQREVRVAGMEVDIIIQKDDVSSPVEVKFTTGKFPLTRLRDTAVRMLSLQSMRDDLVSPLIVIVGETTNEAKGWAQEQFKLRVWDADTLREKARPHKDLYQKLTALTGAEVKAIDETDTQKKERADAAELIQKLEEHEDKNGITPKQYEQLCLKVMAFLFDPFLYGFEKQAETTDGGNRYDFICRIKDGNSFWNSIRSDFRTRSILFECKNYEKPITADQVYSTERYLFAGALRTVCFLISRKGPDTSCDRAAQGALREAGKLILLLSNRNLIEMLHLKFEEDGPTSYLDQKIWQFITTLPR
jgi:hypothetical protein